MVDTEYAGPSTPTVMREDRHASSASTASSSTSHATRPSLEALTLAVTPHPPRSSTRTSPSSRASIWTVRSVATATSISSVDSDAAPPSPSPHDRKDEYKLRLIDSPTLEHAHSVGGSDDVPPSRLLQRSTSLSAVTRPSHRTGARTLRLPFLGHTPLEPSKHVHNGTVRLVGQPTYAVASALASAATEGMPIRHLCISFTWGARLAELLDGVLPAVSEHLETLDLSDCSLGSWPQALRRCTQVRELNLSGNILLSNPPTWLAELTDLRSLILDKTGMSQLPSECVALQHLKMLSLADNHLVQPPLWLYRLPELRQLHLQNNRFYQPWEEMLLPVLQSCPRRSSSTISLESLMPSQSGPSTPTSTSAPFAPRPALAVSQKPALPASPAVAIAEPPKSSQTSSASSKKTSGLVPQPSKSTLGQRWTAMLKRNKTLRSKSVPASQATSPVPPRVSTPASPSPALESDPFAVPVRSISGPAYDEVPTSNGSSSPLSAPLELDRAVGPFDPGWPNLHAGSENNKVESSISVEETHARRVRAVQRYLQDLNDLCSTSPPASSAPSTSRSSSVPVSVTAPLSAPATSTTTIQVNQHVALLQQGARNDPQRRQRVITELIESEQRYVAGLESLVEVYVKPCKNLVPPAQHKLVFSNVESLLHFHKASFFPALRQAAHVLLAPSAMGTTEEQRSLEAAQAVAKVFVDLASFFGMYASYINNCDVAQRVVMGWGTFAPPTVGGRKRTSGPTLGRSSTIRRTRSSSLSTSQPQLPPQPHLQPSGFNQDGPTMFSQDCKALQRHLKKAATDPRSSALGLESYLLLPVQRIPRYRLLLEDLVRCVPVSSNDGEHHPDQGLAMALSAVLKVAKSMNEAKRHAEQELRLCTWQTYLSRHQITLPGNFELVAPHRRLLKEGTVTLLRTVRPGQVYARITPAIPAPSEDTLGLDRSKTISAPRRPPRNSARIQVLHQDMVEEKVTMLLCNDLVLLVSNTQSFLSSSAEPPTIKAQINLKSRDQLGNDGPTIRLRDRQSIYYLGTTSDANAREWVSA